ncbi:MAG: penicillin-binding protein 2, partial [Actinomycetota bacterium]|nr:penicillin-binding protein 2 [Actinomycetota bacterium]
ARRRTGLRLGDPGRRQRAVLVMVLLALLVLAGRLVQLQGFDRPAYVAMATEQRQRAQVLPAIRGSVLDRNGEPLAYTVDARAITVDNRLVEDPRGTAAALAPLLDVPEGELLEKLSDREKAFVYLARRVDPDTARQVRELRLPGLSSEHEPQRLYPGGELAANVVGFTGGDGRGLGGVESAFDSVLAGQDGRRELEVDQKGRQIPTAASSEVPAVPGDDVMLTIDSDLQWTAQRAVSDAVESTEAEGGQVVVMDSRTGEVLALAVTPTFDAGEYASADEEDLGNAALSQVYEPGSVNKVITAAAALEQGVVTPESIIEVGECLQVADKCFSDSHEYEKTEQFTFNGVIAESSNIGTIKVALEMSPQTLYDYMRAFGYGQRTGLGLPGESAGILAAPEKWTGSSRGTIPIGQGVSTTTMQIASVYQTLANGGLRMAPSLVKGTGDGRPVARLQEPRQVIKPETATQLTTMLEAATSDSGTAPQARIDGYRVAGKTGTARRVVDGKYNGYMSSFSGFAPADDPRLVVSVVLDNPKTSIFGGVTAAPVFHDVMAFALAQQQVPPTGAPAPEVALRAE